MRHDIILTVNGDERRLAVRSQDSLLEVLRNDLGLTGTKKGCNIGDCGACTVILDGKAVNACLVLAVDADGGRVQTIEGLQLSPKRLHPLQEEFITHGAAQCGFCTPGMLMAAKALLDEHPAPTAAEIRHALAGNICRCTGYVKIIEAVEAAAQEARHVGD